jgi:nicotinamide mononucleotide transporter
MQIFNIILSWIFENWIEIIAAVLGLCGIFLQIKQNHWYWLTSIIMVCLYFYVFYVTKFYADMAFQLYYLVISIYGWVYWVRKKEKENRNNATKNNIFVKRLNIKQLILYTLISLSLWGVIFLILKNFTNSDVPIGDAFTTALSIIATLLLAKKYIENWLFWIIVDAVSTALYLNKGLYPTAILFFVLTILAIVGLRKWKKLGNPRF